MSMRMRSKWAWIALFVAIPLAYNPVSRWQWEPDKVALVMALTGLLLGQALAERPPRCKPHGRGWWRRAEVWIGLYLLVRLLSAVISVAPHWSVWGDPAWRNSLWFTAAMAVLFVLARNLAARTADRRRMVMVILATSAVVSAYGIAQYVVANWILGQALPRVASTLAHANFLGAYLAMVTPLAMVRAVGGPRRVWCLMLLVLQGACLILTYSRAGWLAAMVGLALVGVLELWRLGRRRAAAWLVLAGVAGFVMLLVLSVLPPLPGSGPHVLQNLTNMFRWQGATVQIRLLGWRATLDAIGERPLLGYGPATSRRVIEWFMPPALAPFGGVAALSGRPHNVFLEVALESGLLGLGGYLAMLCAILLPLIRSVIGDRPRNARFGSAVLGSLAANLVAQVFSLEGAATGVLFWCLAGMALAKPKLRETPPVDRPSRRWLGASVSVASILLSFWLVSVDVLAYAGESILAPRDLWGEATGVLTAACDLSPTPEVFLVVQGNTYAAWAEAQPDAEVWRRGADVYDELVRRSPAVAGYHRAHGWFLRRYHLADENPDLAWQAIDAYSQAIRLSPRDPDLWIDRGLMWIDAGDPDEALADLEQANLLLEGYARTYGAFSIYALAQGDAETAAGWQARAMEAQRAWDAWVWRR
jgi:O-antigen ligase